MNKQKMGAVLLCGTFFFGAACARTGGGSSTAEAARDVTVAMLIEDEPPMEQVIMWSLSREGEYRSFLISGNENEVNLLSSAPGILLADDEQLFHITLSNERIPLCDCERWREAEFEGDCPVSLQTAPITLIALSITQTDTSNATVNDPLEVNLLPIPDEEEKAHQLIDLEQTVEITGSIGPYLFIRFTREGAFCDDKESFKESGFELYNLKTRLVEPLLSDSEAEALEETEKKEAFENISTITGFTHITENDLELARISPVFIYGLGFSVNYEFEAQSRMDNKENNWADYSRAVTIQAKHIPEKLAPYIIAPAPLRQFQHTDDVRVSGWSTVTRNQSAINALLQAADNTAESSE